MLSRIPGRTVEHQKDAEHLHPPGITGYRVPITTRTAQDGASQGCAGGIPCERANQPGMNTAGTAQDDTHRAG